MAHVLHQIGFHVHLVEGGYNALRAALVRSLAQRVRELRWRVVCGPTGSGKTRLLLALRGQGAQVLDLERLAAHRGSVLGGLAHEAQPAQKQFETRIWEQLRGFDAARPVYVEAESRRIGRLQLPPELVEAMRAAPCLRLHTALALRVRLLLEDYAALAADAPLLRERLAALTELRGRKTVAHWQALVDSGAFATLVEELLEQHYDPGYAESSSRHFGGFAAAPNWTLEQADAFDAVAAQIIAAPPPS
jgi:tRNA 2-selenouridine synthase